MGITLEGYFKIFYCKSMQEKETLCVMFVMLGHFMYVYNKGCVHAYF
jgi:hypothetical protein